MAISNIFGILYHRDEYSTTEQVIGKWINGKPLYRKTINFGALPNNATKEVSVGIGNVDWLVSIEGIALNPSLNVFLPLPTTSTSSVPANMAMFYDKEHDRVSIQTGTDRSVFTSCYITLEYTKTTD